MRKHGRGWSVEPHGEYPALWEKISYSAKKRAGWCCEVCGMQFVEGTNLAVSALNRVGRPLILTVHHIDGNKADCSYRNLLVCCQRCHLRVQRLWGPGDPIPHEWMTPPDWLLKRGLPYQECPQLLLMEWC